MKEIDDRLLDYILETLKELVAAVSELYRKSDVSEVKLEEILTKFRKLEAIVEGLEEGDVDRKVNEGKNSRTANIILFVVTPIVSVIASNLVNLFFPGLFG